MPIFDDPRKSLEQMQRQLLREEEEYEEEYLTEDEWLDEEIAQTKALLEMDAEEEEDEDEILYRNFANGYGEFRQTPSYDAFVETDDEEEPEKVKPVSKIRGQLALMFVLLAGIAAVAIYWVAVLL